MAPAGTPQPIIDRLYKDIQEVLKSPELKAAFDREGAAAVSMSSAEFTQYIEHEIVKWGRVVKEGNITAQ
jgi:tripartite-type tricarboxylate transporter receptor subunit TctC